ncbi:hypothetical protein MRX96_031758 [Rhipicephalus microplus]
MARTLFAVPRAKCAAQVRRPLQWPLRMGREKLPPKRARLCELPSEPQRRAAWLRAINRDVPAGMGSGSGFVCSDHFLPQDYETNLNVLRSLGFDTKNARLKRDAIPTQNLLLDAPLKKLRRCEKSQPLINGKPAGNMLMSAGILFSGTSPITVLHMFEHINLQGVHAKDIF